MNIAYFLRDNGACGYYRADLPMKVLGHYNDGVHTAKIEKGEPADIILNRMENADVILMPRLSEPQMIEAMKGLQENGKKIVVDYDDDMFNISPLSPHYEEFGTENVKHRLEDGTVLSLWEDGKNINLDVNKSRVEAVKEGLRTADIVTVTTDILADAYKEYNDNIAVLPNCINPDIWQKLPFQRRDDIRLGWHGGSSHYEDMCMLTDVLPVIMEKYPNVTLVLMGTKFDGMLKGLPQDRIEFHPWVPTPAFSYKLAILDIDIALIPLEDKPFNRCKSPIKWVEYSALEVPSVTSLVSPYKEVYNGSNGVFVEINDPSGWVQGISTLIDDPVLRAKMGAEAKNSVMRNFDIHEKYRLWGDAYGGLV